MHGIVLFYAVAFMYSWGVWGAGIAGFFPLSGTAMVTLGGLGPVLALFVWWAASDRERRSAWLRGLSLRGLPASAWGYAVGLPLAFAAAGVGASLGVGADLPEVLDLTLAGGGFAYGLALLLFGPLPEELAWRHVAYRELRRRHSFFAVQAVVAVLWALWHLPLFFIEGSYQQGLGLVGWQGGYFFVQVLLCSLLTGLLYEGSGYRAPVAIAFHYAVNLFGEMTVFEPAGDLAYVLLACAALCLVWSVREKALYTKQSIR